MSEQQKPCILFDVMSTLVRDPFYEDVCAFFSMSLDDLLEQKSRKAWTQFEYGITDEATLFKGFFEDGRSIDGIGLRKVVEDGFELLPGIEALLDELKATHVEMYALSNYPTWYHMIENKLRLSRWLKWSFVSCDTGYRKPDPAAYNHACDTLARRPGEVIFVDDKERNTSAAEALGLHSILFESAEQLRHRLQAAKVLP